MKDTLTNDQAADLLTVASLRDTLNGRGGIALTDTIREQYTAELNKVEGRIPAGLARVAWAEAAARDPKATLANAMFVWLRDQNVAGKSPDPNRPTLTSCARVAGHV